MKKFTFIVGIVLVAAVLVAVGWFLGAQTRVLTQMLSVQMLDKSLTDTARTASLIHQLDSGRVDDARHMLQLELAGQILTVDSLLDAGDTRNRDLASKVFARIARYRAEYPQSYTGELARIDVDVSAKVDSILQRAAKEQK
jgi:hypothetical protein